MNDVVLAVVFVLIGGVFAATEMTPPDSLPGAHGARPAVLA